MGDNEIKGLEEKAEQKHLANTKIKAIMSKEILSIQKSYSIKSVVEMLKTHRYSGLPVTNDSGKVIGHISEYDLLIQAASKSPDERVIFIPTCHTLEEEMTLKEALIIFYKKRLKRTPIVNSRGILIGSLARIDLLKCLVSGV